jgi:hypothetical protein
MKDQTGHTLEIGQKVIYTYDRSTYIYVGLVKGFTTQRVRLSNLDGSGEHKKDPRHLVILEKI